MNKYPNSPCHWWPGLTPQDANEHEIELVRRIAGDSSQMPGMTWQQYRENLKVCAADIRECVSVCAPPQPPSDFLKELYHIAVDPFLVEGVRIEEIREVIIGAVKRQKELLESEKHQAVANAQAADNNMLSLQYSQTEARELYDALVVLLPMARGYALEHSVGNNQAMVDAVAAMLAQRQKERT